MQPREPVRRLAPRLVADTSLGAVRVNFRYAAFQSMAAGHSEKAGRDQFFEGPHETNGFRRHESLPLYIDLQYQPLTFEWETPAGKVRRFTLDYAVETQDHRIVLGEDKADEAYFEEAELEETLDFIEAFLQTKGASLERRVVGGSHCEIERRVIKDIFDARRTEFGDGDVARAQAVVRANGGAAPLKRVMKAIGHHPERALDMTRAMMHGRFLEMPVSARPMPDTPVTIPTPAKKGALRAFLAAHIPGEGVAK